MFELPPDASQKAAVAADDRAEAVDSQTVSWRDLVSAAGPLPMKRNRSRHEPNRFSLSHEGGPKYFEIVDSEDVLIVEDSLDRILRFRQWLRRARLSPTADHAIAAIRQRMPTTVFLDRDLSGPSFGEEVATFLAAEKFSGRVIITSANPFGVQVISKILGDAGIQFEAVPFSILGIVRAPCQ